MDEALQNICNQIKTSRKKKGWTQQQLAEYSGLDRTTIGSIERNGFSDIGIRKFGRVLELLGLQLAIRDVGLPTLDELLVAKKR